MDQLLDVSRQLTAAAASGDIDRSVVRGALSLVHADGGALVLCEDGSLSIGVETKPGLLLAESLAGGCVGRAAETGQPIVQVSATEPAVSHLPASIAAVPLVAAGRVDAVLVLVRSGDFAYSASERTLLQSFATDGRSREEQRRAGAIDP